MNNKIRAPVLADWQAKIQICPSKTIVLFQRLMSLSIKKLTSNSVLASTTPPQIPIQI
jgi:hypothetical protein